MRGLRGFVIACVLIAGVNAAAQTKVPQPTVNPTSVPQPSVPQPTANPTSVPQPNVNPTSVPQPNVPTTPNVPAPQTGPGPSTGANMGIRLEVEGRRPSDFAHAQYKPGDSVGLGASYYDTANGASMGTGCIPEYDLSDFLAPDGTARASFGGIGAEITGGGTKCHGSCRINFIKPGAFSVHVHCLDNPQISSAGNQGDFNFETSNAPWAGPRTLQPVRPSLLHPQAQPQAPATPPPTDAGKGAAGGHKGMSVGTQLLIGALLVGGVIAVVAAASPGGGGGGGGTTVYCFDVSASCSAAGRYCDFTEDACMVDESDVLKLCSDSCNCQISRGCFSCTMNVDGCMPSGARIGPPQDVDLPVSNGVAARRLVSTADDAPDPYAPPTHASAGFPWLKAAEVTVLV
ncbi:MAG TPA: hypothetical protein VL326_35945, partial [Kofleriaceae bacterium]|nr:hypothetical protein [Kofleriaceae bacterium]